MEGTSNKLTITNLKKFIIASVALSNGFAEALEDGKIGVSDLFILKDIVAALKDFSGVNFKELLPEMNDLTENEKDELVSFFKLNFDIENDDREAVIESCFEVVLEAISAVSFFIELSKKVK